MDLADVVALVMFLGIIAYAVFAGADFGSGIWDLGAGNAEDGGPTRRLIDHAIGPVWEANHVWLIFVLVFLWTGFPEAFGAIMSTLYVPFSFVALGIIFRGCGFAFRKFADDLNSARLFGVAFALSSLLTPFFLGMIAGAIASGRVPIDGSGNRWTSWIGPTSWVGGLLAVLTCAFLAAVFLAADAERLGHEELTERFRRRAFVTAIICGVAAIGGVAPLLLDAETLADGLLGKGVGFMIVSGASGLASIVLLHKSRLAAARLTAVTAVAAVVGGWGVAQYPWVLVDHAMIAEVAGDSATLWGLLISFGVAAVLVLPSLAYLYLLTDKSVLGTEFNKHGQDHKSVVVK